MKLIRLLANLIVFSSLLSCAAQSKPLPKIGIHHFVKVLGNYQKIYQVQDLPNVISDYFNKDRFGADMVGPESSEFNSSFGTQLISAGNSGEIWFIEFWVGGTGRSKDFLAFRVRDKKILSLIEINELKVLPSHVLSLTIANLESKLPTQPICAKKDKDYAQYSYEIGYRICPDQY
jgi:hypothetical protein